MLGMTQTDWSAWAIGGPAPSENHEARPPAAASACGSGHRGRPMSTLARRTLALVAATGLATIGLVAAPSTADAATTFSNTSPISIPASGTQGPGSPYPSSITVSGLPGAVSGVTAS